jgi:N-acetylmuramoyl-L-alanine amidase
VFLSFFNTSFSKENLEFLEYKAKVGDNITTVFKKYGVELNDINSKKLKELNKKNRFTKKDGFKIGLNYNLPIVITHTATKDNDILTFNKNLEKKGLKYKVKKTAIYIPYDIYQEKKKTLNSETSKTKITKAKKEEPKEEEVEEPKKEESKKDKDIESTLTEKLFGKNYSKVPVTDKQLAGRVFYLDPGHGGPDPGAIGELNGNRICEDEYAYDVTLRLAYDLMTHGAKVYVLVHDLDDGIRDEQFLKVDNNEVYLDGSKISPKQKTRLEQRISIVNKLSKKNQKKYKSQDMLVIHLDSREDERRIDIFFYYQENNDESYKFATDLYKTIEDKYQKYQPGRGYTGDISTRNLYMLDNSPINTVFMELGNIKNSEDQKRFIQKKNRQAIADWLCDGILYHYPKATQKNTKK